MDFLIAVLFFCVVTLSFLAELEAKSRDGRVASLARPQATRPQHAADHRQSNQNNNLWPHADEKEQCTAHTNCGKAWRHLHCGALGNPARTVAVARLWLIRSSAAHATPLHVSYHGQPTVHDTFDATGIVSARALDS